MKAQGHFSTALSLLDAGNCSRGEFSLRQAVVTAEQENNELVLCSALFRLGELLVETNRATEAEPILSRVLKLDRQDGAVFMETAGARELLKLNPSHA